MVAAPDTIDPAILPVIAISAGGTGATTQNFVDLSSAQTIAGAKSFSGAVSTGPLTVASFIQAASGFLWLNYFSGTTIAVGTGASGDSGTRLNGNGSVTVGAGLSVLGAATVAASLVVAPSAFTATLAAGDIAVGRSASAGVVQFGLNGTQYLDYGITAAGAFTFTGGPLVAPGISATTGAFSGAVSTGPLTVASFIQAASGFLWLNYFSGTTIAVGTGASGDSGTRLNGNGSVTVGAGLTVTAGLTATTGAFSGAVSVSGTTATISSGSAVPSAANVAGSIYIRTPGAAGARIYIGQGGTSWTPLPTV